MLALVAGGSFLRSDFTGVLGPRGSCCPGPPLTLLSLEKQHSGKGLHEMFRERGGPSARVSPEGGNERTFIETRDVRFHVI